MILIEFTLQCVDAGGGCFARAQERGDLTRNRPSEAVELTADRTHDGLAVPRVIEDHQKALSEAVGLETLLHHAKCRLFLADDQHGLAPCNAIRHNVYDRLALAGPWWPLDQ